MGELKNKAVRGFGWNIGEKIFSAVFSAWVVVNVTNRVFPEDYALKAILAAFVLIFNSFVDSGFSQALIRNRAATGTDYSSAFWFNIAIAVAVYFALVGLAYPAAALLRMPRLTDFAPVFFLVVPLAALGIIQQTVLTRDFDFRRLSAITFAATVASGLIAVWLATKGAGFWAIVAQRVAQTATRSALLWAFGRWRPEAKFSSKAIRKMFGYSSRLLAADLLTNTYNAVPQMVIGRIHGAALGNFDQARSIRDLPLTSTVSSMQSVTFPALAAVSGDEAKYRRALGFSFGSIAFLMFPMMAGLMSVAGELFGVFLAPQWQASVPFFRILCLAGFATPLASVSANILRTRSDGRAVLRVEIARKIAATAILAATIPLGVVAITWGVVAIAFTDFFVSFAASRSHSGSLSHFGSGSSPPAHPGSGSSSLSHPDPGSGSSAHSCYGFRSLARDVLPTLGLTAAMAGAVWFSTPPLTGLAPRVTAWLGLASLSPLWLVLGLKIVLGAAVYLSGAWLLRLPALLEAVGMARKLLRRYN